MITFLIMLNYYKGVKYKQKTLQNNKTFITFDRVIY